MHLYGSVLENVLYVTEMLYLYSLFFQPHTAYQHLMQATESWVQVWDEATVTVIPVGWLEDVSR